MVDATIIAAPPATKNKEYARDPEMHQAKKGNEWHFGMKAHIGADADSGLVHSLHTTAANESDLAQAHEVLHGQESAAFLDAATPEPPSAKRFCGRSARAIFASKTRYKGMAKKEAQLYSLFGLANLVLAKKRLMAMHATETSAS